MKKYVLTIAGLMLCNSLFAKKVKFAVDMSNELVNTTGIHVYGDFQVAAGYSFDWDPGSTQMIQEAGDTNVYSIVVDIPAFAVYEYRFINGDQSYEIEFVPEESRVNGSFNDNRWMYVDSAANDTTFIGIFPYSGNAPDGLSLVVFKVNMIQQTVSPQGVHVAGTFQGWDPAKSTMVTFNDTVYRYQAYIPNGTYQYKFVNGNTSGDYEYVAGPCAVSGNREVVVTGDIALDPVNFSSCLVNISESMLAANITLFPNPSHSFAEIEFGDNSTMHRILISDLAGRELKNYISISGKSQIDNLEAGVYLVSVINSENQQASLRLVVQ